MRGICWASALVVLLLAGCGSATTVTQTTTVTKTTSATASKPEIAASTRGTTAPPKSAHIAAHPPAPPTDIVHTCAPPSSSAGTTITSFVARNMSCAVALRHVTEGRNAPDFGAWTCTYDPGLTRCVNGRMSFTMVYREQSTPSTPASTEQAGSYDHSTDEQFCSTHQCIENFPNGSGYIVQCVDGEWSHSGGLSGACSDHGGES
jgi:hypothetical protein